jgi:hypothetical protein
MKKIRFRKKVNEEAPTNSAGSGNIAGLGVGAKGEPGISASVRKRHKSRILRRSPPQALPMGWFAGKKTFKVPSHVYENVKLAKRKYQHWTKYLNEDEVGRAIREFANRNPNDPIIIECERTGYMVFARYGRK